MIKQLLATSSILGLLSVAAAQTDAAGGYNIVTPSNTVNDAANINAALDGVLPVMLTLDAAHPTWQFSITSPINVPAGKSLVCESAEEIVDWGVSGGATLYPAPGFSGNAVVNISGVAGRVKNCIVNGFSAPGLNADCFASTLSYVTFDSVQGYYCQNGLNLTANGGAMINPHIFGHSYFYQNQQRGMNVGYDPNGGYTSDIYFEGVNLGKKLQIRLRR
jgi:hypothetical protein